ncbi:MAG: hypothetical protein MUD01_23715 [Chloroflexaceae bacterium]|jgi:hypothetical protein|nr:hypothetical protein [Chloroflexaceae bacterium]
MPSRYRRQQQTALRRVLAPAGWLGGRPEWYEGRIVWRDHHGLMLPDANDLALAERALRQAARIATAADAALLNRYRSRLSLARHLAPLHAAELRALVQPLHARQPANQRRLVALLAAEVACPLPLPESPAAALLAAGPPVASVLVASITNESVPLAARSLAALLLGALAHTHPEATFEQNWPDLSAVIPGAARNPGVMTPETLRGAKNDKQEDVASALQHAYTCGLQLGLPPDPAFAAALLAVPDGLVLARRCFQAVSESGRFGLPPALLRELLLGGNAAPPATAELAEAGVTLAELLTELTRRPDLPADASRPRRNLAERLLLQRGEFAAAMHDLACRYARSSACPATLQVLPPFMQAMLRLGPASPDLQRATVAALEIGLRLPPTLQRCYLEQLTSRHHDFWPPEAARAAGAPGLGAWLDSRRPAVQALARQLRRQAYGVVVPPSGGGRKTA